MDFVVALRRGGYQKPRIRDEHLPIIKSLIEAKNDLLLRELCKQFRERTGISVSVSTMHRAVQKLRLRRKKNSIC